eukprot:CAMPEP_0170060764 /NCGR_PEP_ID=MMETSP0019_2-20121128/2587_1 /TAXON_ID=98059 /ORGANISM="Dinobryon sp., Strain UTEXLB2267" /LENGTH=271 /DNA_ID=CAMNT_0010266431 /DNA_START=1454 /DNA_END=2269 /DNA_ORIENTATION=-
MTSGDNNANNSSSGNTGYRNAGNNNHSSHGSHYSTLIRWLGRAVRRHAVLLESKDIELFNSTLINMLLSQSLVTTTTTTSSSVASLGIMKVGQQAGVGLIDPKQLLHELRSVDVRSNHSNSQSSHSSTHVAAVSHHTLNLQHFDKLVTPLQVFVASDDLSVLQTAIGLGFLADDSGISQQTASNGMLKTLMAHPELGYNASLEIISDIFFLSQCSTLLGIAGSQVFRMSVALSNSSDLLNYAVAVDADQLHKVRHMSMKYHVPFPEEFYKP